MNVSPFHARIRLVRVLVHRAIFWGPGLWNKDPSRLILQILWFPQRVDLRLLFRQVPRYTSLKRFRLVHIVCLLEYPYWIQDGMCPFFLFRPRSIHPWSSIGHLDSPISNRYALLNLVLVVRCGVYAAQEGPVYLEALRDLLYEVSSSSRCMWPWGDHATQQACCESPCVLHERIGWMLSSTLTWENYDFVFHCADPPPVGCTGAWVDYMRYFPCLLVPSMRLDCRGSKMEYSEGKAESHREG